MSVEDIEIESLPNAQDKNLDMVRNILFGEQSKENDRRLASLERFVKVWTNSVRDEMRRSFENLHHEINMVNDLLTEESKARLNDTATARKHFEQNSKSIENLYKQLQATQENVHQRIDLETNRLNDALQHQREDFTTQLKFAAEQLRQDKVDRKMLAHLLEGVSRHLAGETV